MGVYVGCVYGKWVCMLGMCGVWYIYGVCVYVMCVCGIWCVCGMCECGVYGVYM